ncbi:MAG: hypothetical protein U1E27_01540 [Kiritimatiellia bacterium]|nr:hypothetical protein [Kiritimatiellia bacterium]
MKTKGSCQIYRPGVLPGYSRDGFSSRSSWRTLGWALLLGWAVSAQAQIPPFPAAVSASKGTYAGGIRVWWTPVTGASAYDIWRSASDNKQTAQYLASVGGSKSEYIDSQVPANTLTYYWVRTVVNGVPSDFGYSHEGFWNPGPAAPTNVQATDGLFVNRIRLTWNSSTNATGYQIWRALINDKLAAALVATQTGTTYFDDWIDPQLTYHYWVKALNSEGISGFSGSNPGFARPEPPGAVQNISASDGASLAFIRIAWDPTPGTAAYEIWRASGPELWNSVRIASAVTKTFYEDAAVSPLQVHTYWVRAVNSLGYGPFSGSDSGFRELRLPAKPLSVTASDGMFSSRIRLTWQAAERAFSYEILRNVVRDLPSATVLARVPAGEGLHEYWDTTAAGSRVYFYWIRGINNAGPGEVSWSTDGFWNPGPAAPTFVRATDGTLPGAVEVLWVASDAAVGYQVWRNTIPHSPTAVQVGNVNQPSFFDPTALPGEMYFYWVKAWNASGTSGFSWSDSGYAMGPVPVVRAVSLATRNGLEGETVFVPVTLTAKGDENALGFSVQFNPGRVEIRNAVAGSGLPPGSLLIPNQQQLALGRFGVAVALPPGSTVPPGSVEMVRLEIVLLPGSANQFVPLGFTDLPSGREVVAVTAQPLETHWVDGGLQVGVTPAPGIEADVSPAPDGDGRVTLQDWVQIGRFVAGLDPAPSGNRFQRADCAPRATLGDGVLALNDWVQAGRYAQGLDPLTDSAGVVTGGSLSAGSPIPLGIRTLSEPVSTRVSVADGSLLDRPFASVLVESGGQINALSFSVRFDKEAVAYHGMRAGPELQQAGGMLLVNESQAGSGRLGVAVALPPGMALPAGLRKVAELHLSPVHPEVPGTTVIQMTDDVLARSAVRADAQSLTAAFQSGTLTTGPAEENGDPDDSTDSPSLQAASEDGWSEIVFSWFSRAGRTYRVERSTDLIEWKTLDRVTGQEGRTEYRCRIEGETRGFLRVAEEP